MSYFVHSTSVVDEGAEIGDDTSIWFFSHIRSKAKIGRNCHIGQNVYIDDYVSIGDGCKIQNNVSVYDGVILENDVFVGPSVVFTNDINPRAFIKKGHENYKITIVEEGATIAKSGTSEVTTAPAATNAYFPIRFPHTIVAFAPIVAPSSTIVIL